MMASSNKRKASDFFLVDVLHSSSQQTSDTNQPTTAVTTKPSKSRAQILKESIQRQFALATASDCTAKPDQRLWVRSDAGDVSKALLFDEKFLGSSRNGGPSHLSAGIRTIIDDEQVSTIGSSNYFQRAPVEIDQQHHDAIFRPTSSGRSVYHGTDTDRNNDSDEQAQFDHVDSGGSGERIMITSFSTTSDRDTRPAADEYVPQSKFGKLMLAKGNAVRTAVEGGSALSCTDAGVTAEGAAPDVPLYKRLRAKDYVRCRHPAAPTAPPRPAQIRSVMHGGYTSAMYDVVFAGGDGRIETVSWTAVDSIMTAEAAAQVQAPIQPPPPTLSSGAPAALSIEELAILTAATASSLSNSNSYQQQQSRGALSGRGGGHYGYAPPPPPPAPLAIRSIRFDSATGLAIINDDDSGGAPSSRAAAVAEPTGSNAVTANATPSAAARRASRLARAIETPAAAAPPVKDWTVNPEALSAAITATDAPKSAAVVAPLPPPLTAIVDEPLVNPTLLQKRSKGGWKTARR